MAVTDRHWKSTYSSGTLSRIFLKIIICDQVVCIVLEGKEKWVARYPRVQAQLLHGVMDCLYGPVGLLRANLRAGVVNSGADPLERQRTGRIARGVRRVRPYFVVTAFVGINEGPFRGTGWPG